MEVLFRFISRRASTYPIDNDDFLGLGFELLRVSLSSPHVIVRYNRIFYL